MLFSPIGLYGTKYSRIDKINFLKAVFHKLHLVDFVSKYSFSLFCNLNLNLFRFFFFQYYRAGKIKPQKQTTNNFEILQLWTKFESKVVSSLGFVEYDKFQWPRQGSNSLPLTCNSNWGGVAQKALNPWIFTLPSYQNLPRQEKGYPHPHVPQSPSPQVEILVATNLRCDNIL